MFLVSNRMLAVAPSPPHSHGHDVQAVPGHDNLTLAGFPPLFDSIWSDFCKVHNSKLHDMAKPVKRRIPADWVSATMNG
jgi:hypothetical protein